MPLQIRGPRHATGGLALAAAVALSGCAVDPSTGAQSIAGVKISDDPCASTATVAGAVLGGVVGTVIGSQVSKSNESKIVGGLAGAGIGAAIGHDMDKRRCEMVRIARAHNAEITVTSVVLPKGDLPPAAGAAAAAGAPAGEGAAGLSVSVKDSGRQFASGSDHLSPEAEAMFREIARTYSPERRKAALGPAASADERAAVETLRTRRVLLVGHTDDIGNSRDNADLSERRAQAVARVFREEGVPDANLFFQGAGETLPLGDNRSDAGRAANRRVEIVDVTDDASFRKYLAMRRQPLQFYRAPAATAAVADAASGAASAERTQAPAKGGAKRRAAGFVDFGGVPAADAAGPADFTSDAAHGQPAGVLAGAPAAPTCSADRPRLANPVKSLANDHEVPMSDYVPGLYNTSWSDTVNGHLVGLTNVDVLRDGGAPAARPTLLVWKNYDAVRKKGPDFTTQPEVNVYRGSKAILYRVFVGGPMKCMDVLFPYDNSGQARNSSLFYDRQASTYVATFELKSLSAR
jgi:outer membrane protein OmpA-like peptidoglycan-associated protein